MKKTIYTSIIIFLLNTSVFVFAEDNSKIFKDKIKNDLNTLSNNYLDISANYIKSLPIKLLGNEIKTKEINISLENNEKPKIGVLFLTPFFDLSKIEDTFFMQNSLFHEDNRTTINTGLGYRKLTLENNLLIGVNGFYDHEFPYNHGRTSLGLELRTTVGEINANRYWSTRDWVTANSNNTERALSGHDIEASVPLPYINWANLSYNKFHWYGKEIENIGGTKTSLSAIIPQLPNLLIRIDRTKYNSDAIDNTDSLTLSYVFKASEKKQVNKSFFNNKAYELSSIENERFNLVNRENEILKEVNNDGVFNFKGV